MTLDLGLLCWVQKTGPIIFSSLCLSFLVLSSRASLIICLFRRPPCNPQQPPPATREELLDVINKLQDENEQLTQQIQDCQAQMEL